MNEAKLIHDHVAANIGYMEQSPDAPALHAMLRRGVGKRMDESIESWEMVLSNIPQELMGGRFDTEPTEAENAVHTALTLYALHQQSKDYCVNVPRTTFGQAVGELAKVSRNPDTIKRRMDAILTSNDVNELAVHARGVIQLMRASDKPMGFDYPRLAEDLYWFQVDSSRRRSVMLSWGEDYYRCFNEKPENSEDKSEKPL